MKKPRPRLLLIDNFDSFTYNLWDYFLRLGAVCEVVRNDQPGRPGFDIGNYHGLVLSPGPGRPEDAGGLMSCIAAFHLARPILGICLGHQALGSFFGATLVKARKPMHGKTSLISHSGDSVFAGLPMQIEVMRYHSLILEDFPGEVLEKTAWTGEGEIMALRHRDLPLTGVQFHPESVQTDYGLGMLENWLEQNF